MDIGDIVWVPFPHVEDNRSRSRPALVVAVGLGGRLNLFWALMITAAANDAWPGDVLVSDHERIGLPIPARIRTGKIATLAAESATPVGRLPVPLLLEVQRLLAEALRLRAE